MKITTIIKNILPYGISSYFVKKGKAKLEIPSSEEPPIYNHEGKKLKTIFLSSNISRHFPYCFVTGQYPNYILWDRNNYGLKNHVYVHDKILFPQGEPSKKFAFFIESESIVPEDYNLFSLHKGLDKDFDLIFTHSIKLLDAYSNAVFIPSGGVHYGTLMHGGFLDIEQYEKKSKNISLVSSNLTICDLHKFRLNLAKYYKNSSYVDTYGTFDGGAYIKIADSLKDYRYSIAIENDISPYRFTEKILNCFAAMTVPIYIGATKIVNFFNTDGIIQIEKLDFDHIDKIIKNCNEYDYAMRISALIDNYNRVNDYLCIEDYMYKHYSQYFS